MFESWARFVRIEGPNQGQDRGEGTRPLSILGCELKKLGLRGKSRGRELEEKTVERMNERTS